MDVSIIIVNYKTANLVVDAVNSVFKMVSGLSFEVIIVDNNSKDDSEEVLKNCFGNKIIFLKLNANLGFGQANNAGIKIAKGRCMFFLNPDTILLNNAIGILYNFMKQDKLTGAVGGNLYTDELKPAYSYSKYFPGLIMDELPLLTFGYSKKLIKNAHHNFSNKPIKVSAISGADMMVRRSILDKVGYFNPAFFMYFEDTELCWRIRKAGFEIFNIPSAKIIHLEGSSFEFKETRVRYSLQSRATFHSLTKGKVHKECCDLFYLLGINVNIFVFWIFSRDYNYYRKLKRVFLGVRLKN